MSLFMEIETERELPFDAEEVAKLVIGTALDYVGCPYETEINLLLTTDEEMKEMNRTHRQIDRTTDVLSFSDDRLRHSGRFFSFGRQDGFVSSRDRGTDAWRYCDFSRQSIYAGGRIRSFSSSGICIFDRA